MSHPSTHNATQRVVAALLATCAFSTVYAQQTAEQLHQRATAAMCANCHGTEGRAVEGSAIPALAGMPKDYMLLQMKAFKDGSRPATVMHQITKGLTDAQIETLATYYAATKR
jgi:sulfide dehydrogenase cytochrome subunit